MRKRVYIPSVPTRFDPISRTRTPVLDLQPASNYGELVPLIDPQTNVRATDLNSLIETIQEGIQNIKPDDFLICVGDSILVAAAVAYATDLNGRVNCLRWDKQMSEYECLEVVL